MKTHYCTEEQTTITFEDECNWCGEKEQDNERSIQEVSAGVLVNAPASETDEDFPIPVAPI